MSSIIIHVGQCGNQVSVPLWQHFTSPFQEKKPFLSLDNYHRSIHIDSEPKVINTLPKNWKIRDSNLIVGKRGRGSNFALGYNGLTHRGDDHLLETFLDAMRKETERCDLFSGTMVCHSLSGGTGSGMGCRLIETIRDAYPSRHILCCAVVPCVSGESPLQNFNSLLSLRWLQLYSDATILLHNDNLISRLTRTSSSEESTASVSFKTMNQLAANCMYGAFSSTDTLNTKHGSSLGQEPWELVRTLAPMPSNKFIMLDQHVSSNLSWDDLVSKNLQRHPKWIDEDVPSKCLASTLIGRGDRSGTFHLAIKRGLDKKVKKSLRTVDWNPYPLDIWMDKSNLVGSQGSSSVTMATNSSGVVNTFDSILSHSLLKLESGAYLHWYKRHGISKDVFEESVDTMQTVIEEYKGI